jgi:hypothetical protein
MTNKINKERRRSMNATPIRLNPHTPIKFEKYKMNARYPFIVCYEFALEKNKGTYAI